MRKSNKLLLVSFILGTLYVIYLVAYFFMSMSQTGDSGESLGVGIAFTIALPHMICALLAAIFNGIGLFMNKRGLILAGAILYTVACVAMPLWFMFTVIQAILSYIGYAQLKKA